MNYNINQGIGVFENAISNEWCDKVIDLFEASKDKWLDRQEYEGHSSTMIADKAMGLQFLDPILAADMVTHFYKNIYPLYIKKFSVLSEGGAHTITDVKIQKTLPSEGYHLWHCEKGCFENTLRVAAYTIYLNDVEEGGETEFLHQSLRLSPKKGTFAIWPSGYYHTHRGNPPLSGKKYIATGWLEYIPEKEIMKEWTKFYFNE